MKKLLTSSAMCANYLTALVFILVPFHAFLTVFGSSLVGHYTVLRLWDLGVVLLLMGVLSYWLVREPDLRKQLISNVLVRLVAIYIVLSLSLGVVAQMKGEVTIKALGFSLIVNTRFLVWFLAIYVLAKRSDWLRLRWYKLVIWPAFLICLFALLQFFLLPPKFLAHFGYDSVKNVAPVTTINQYTQTVRVQSFMRGPNPLGAYLVLVLSIVITFATRQVRSWRQWLIGVLAALVLLLTFSRSAWIGCGVAVMAAIFLRIKSQRTRLWTASVVGVILLGTVFATLALLHKPVVQDALLHASPEAHLKDTSNHGHSTALRSGLSDLVREPFGRGPGTAGPASVYNTPHAPRNSENYFLEIGLETGWAGLLLFIAINLALGLELWHRRVDKLALMLFVSLLGLSVLNQFAYAWSDDTLAFVWWGLAGIALGQPVVKTPRTESRKSRENGARAI